MRNLILFIAQGFGSGLVPRAPGTAGSLVGFIWFTLLLALGKFWLFVAGCIAGIILSVWLCGEAEKILNRHDPGSIVLDEIIAIPICWLSWMAFEHSRHGALPSIAGFFSNHWLACIAVFGTFRFFDVIKPTPVRQAQYLSRGLGVTMDDVVAAAYTNCVTVALYLLSGGA